jgi:hypothetical protein
MVIDEAQKIKNHGALVSKAVKEVGNAIGHTRIALSGAMVTCGAGRRWRWWEVRVGGLTLVSWFLLLCFKPIIFCLRRSPEEDFAWLNQHRTSSNVNGQLRSQRVKPGGNHGIEFTCNRVQKPTPNLHQKWIETLQTWRFMKLGLLHSSPTKFVVFLN